MSGQNTLLAIASDPEVKRPSHKWNWQVYRDTAIAGSGTYKAMDENGVIEIIGGPGAGFGATNIESGTFTKQAADIQTIIATTRQVKIVHFISQDTINGSGSSNGLDNLTNHASLSTSSIVISGNSDLNNSINVSAGLGVGSQGRISAINPNSFVIDWTNTGAGSTINVVWFAITN